MSWKIYDAYRLECSLNEALHWLNQTYTPIVQKSFIEYIRVRAESIDLPSDKERMSEAHAIWDKERRTAPKNSFEFGLQFSVFTLKTRIYLIPSTGYLVRWDKNRHFLLESGKFSDFSYFNNTDRPPEIPAREWSKRKKTWEAIEDAGWHSLVLPISTEDGFFTIDPRWKSAWGDPKHQMLIDLWKAPLPPFVDPKNPSGQTP